MQHQPTANQVVGKSSQSQRQLSYEQDHNQGQASGADSLVHDRLRDERHQQAYDTRGEHRQKDLDYVGAVRPQVLEHIAETIVPAFVITLFLVEFRGGFQNQGYAFRFPLGFQPQSAEILLGVFKQTGRGISDHNLINPMFLHNIIDDHKMTLIPVDYARQRHLLYHLPPSHLDTSRAETDGLSRVTDSQQGHSLPCDVASVPKVLKTIVLAVELCHHLQACWTAVHRIVLNIFYKFHLT